MFALKPVGPDRPTGQKLIRFIARALPRDIGTLDHDTLVIGVPEHTAHQVLDLASELLNLDWHRYVSCKPAVIALAIGDPEAVKTRQLVDIFAWLMTDTAITRVDNELLIQAAAETVSGALDTAGEMLDLNWDRHVAYEER